MSIFNGELVGEERSVPTENTFGGELVTQEVDEEGLSFMERMEQNVENRQEEVTRTFDDLFNRRITNEEAVLQILGKGVAGPALDAIGEGVVSLGQGVAATFPETTESALQAFKAGYDALQDTDVGAAAIDAVKGGIDSWHKFSESNPRAAKNIESAVNIAAIVAPPKVKANAKPTVIRSTANLIDDVANKQIAKSRAAFIGDLVSPKATPKVKIERVARTAEKGVGPFRRNVVLPSPKEAAVADVVSGIKGVSPKNTVQRNFNAIQRANRDSARKLERSLSARKIPMSKKAAEAGIDDTITTLAQRNPLIVGNAETTARRAGDFAKQLVRESDGTAAGMLRARRKFDDWVIAQKGDKAFSDIDNALTISVREIRGKMNDLTDDAVKRYGQRRGAIRLDGVKSELNKQSKMFDALENIAPKAADESSMAIGRLWQNATKMLPFKSEVTRELALLFGMPIIGASTFFAPYITGGLAIAGATYAGGKAVMSPQLKKGLSKLLKMTDRAISTSKNPSMIKQLRADRAIVLDALKAAEQSEKEDGGDNAP